MNIPSEVQAVIDEYKSMLEQDIITADEYKELIEDLAANAETMKMLQQEQSAITAFAIATAIKNAAGVLA